MRLAVLLASLAGPGAADGIAAARYGEPTTRYAHGVLGDAVEWGTLVMRTEAGRDIVVRLPQSRVFEDTAPRLADLDGDGDAEVIAVETEVSQGARLSVYDAGGLVAATEHIGRTNRWLAPAGTADFDGDGRVETAYVDRPHLARTLRIVRLEGDGLVPVAAIEGVTNHRIGDPEIAGGVRDCGGRPRLVLLSPDWRRVVSVGIAPADIRDVGANDGPDAVARAMACGD